MTFSSSRVEFQSLVKSAMLTFFFGDYPDYFLCVLHQQQDNFLGLALNKSAAQRVDFALATGCCCRRRSLYLCSEHDLATLEDLKALLFGSRLRVM